jgi:isoleucyl-tRNA synthetase
LPSVHELKFEDLKSLKLSHHEEKLLRQVDRAKKIILLGRSLRGEAKIGLRQPLQSLRVAGLSAQDETEIQELKPLICQEVNVIHLELVEKASDLVEESVRPNFKVAGKKLGADLKEFQNTLMKWTQKDIQDFEKNKKMIFKNHELTNEHIEIVRKAKAGRSALAQYGLVAELNTELTAELIDQEIQSLIAEAEERARRVLTDNKAKMEKMVKVLMEKETIEEAEIVSILKD